MPSGAGVSESPVGIVAGIPETARGEGCLSFEIAPRKSFAHTPFSPPGTVADAIGFMNDMKSSSRTWKPAFAGATTSEGLADRGQVLSATTAALHMSMTF